MTDCPIWMHLAALRRAGATVLRAGAAAGLLAAPAAAHEAWLLTPSEVADLSQRPMPALFTSTGALALAAGVALVVAAVALRAEDRLRPLETRVAAPLVRVAPAVGPLLVRLGLAAMLALAALGGLPRAGVPAWTQPTLLVPDMQLALAPGWGWIASAEIVLAGFLAAGLAVRLAAVGVILLAALGFAAFGLQFVCYAPHFVAPALFLAIFGGGALALDRPLGLAHWLQPTRQVAAAAWGLALALLGGTFVYLSIEFKLTQPTLIIAILEHGRVPLMGLPPEVAALIMAGVELVAGALLAMGRLVRPIAVVLMGGFTFFAVTLGETPLLHANLYGAMAMLLLAGRALPAAEKVQPSLLRLVRP